MEKFLWDVGGVVLFALSALCMAICLVSSNRIWCAALIALAFADWLYKEKRPVWIEV
jgi:hypothetical protein